MDDPLLMRMLDRIAYRNEKFKPLSRVMRVIVAELVERNAADEFHHKVGLRRIRCTGIKNPRDVGVIHHRDGLSLSFKSSKHLARLHARLDDFQRNSSLHRFSLICDKDETESTFTDLLHELVRPDHGA